MFLLSLIKFIVSQFKLKACQNSLVEIGVSLKIWLRYWNLGYAKVQASPKFLLRRSSTCVVVLALLEIALPINLGLAPNVESQHVLNSMRWMLPQGTCLGNCFAIELVFNFLTNTRVLCQELFFGDLLN